MTDTHPIDDSITKEMAILRAEALNRDLEEALQETMAKNRYIKLLTTIAITANKAKDIHDALYTAIKEICYYTDWPVGHCYIYNKKTQRLESTGQWHVSEKEEFEAFRHQTEATYPTAQNSWIGEVYSSGRPRWIKKDLQHQDCLRKDSAHACGIRAGFAFPIFLEDQVFGVMEFFSRRIEAPDQSLMDVMSDIGTQLGHVVERKQFEHKARLFEAVVVNANDGIMITRNNAEEANGPEITFVNKALCSITGYEKQELLGQTPRMLQGEKTDRDTLHALKENISAGKPFKGELINYGKQGNEYWLDVSIVPISNRDGEVTHYAAIERDITERKQFVEDLLNAKDQAESASKAKSDFLANMSHELRTPMNGILGMAGLLLDTPMNQEQEELARTIQTSSENLLAILNDILDLSKIEAGMVEVDEVPYDIRNALHDTTKIYTAIVMEKDLEPIKVEIDKEIPYCLVGDLNKIQQILRNLLSNALKFTQAGGVRVKVDVTGEMLKFTVIDTGIGIPEDRRRKIFDKFTQADESTTRNFGGTGLGLAICKEFTELMGGEIGVESEVGSGSSFWFTIPYMPVNGKIAPVNQRLAAHIDSNAHLVDAKILVVDDHPINRLFAKKLLSKLGYGNVTFAEDGVQAITEFSTGQYDLILLDCQMPVLDGYSAAREIREVESNMGNETRIPIVAMTANAMIGDREKCLDAGMDEYISKPIKPEILEAKLYDLLIQRFPEKAEASLLMADAQKKEDDAPGTNVAATTTETETPTDMPYEEFDLSRLDDFFDTEEEKRELIELFLEQADENIRMLSEALDVGDASIWKSYAHRLKGACANFGAEKLSAIAFEAEQANAHDRAVKEALYEQAVQSYSSIRESLMRHV